MQLISFPSFCLVLISLFLMTACGEPNDKSTQDFVLDTSLCDFTKGACIKKLGDLDISLNITPHNTPSEKPLEVEIVSNKPINIQSARLEGRDMFMGVIPLKLNEVSKTRYKGVLVYGSCSSGYMVWSLFVNVEAEGKPQTLIFDFLADS